MGRHTKSVTFNLPNQSDLPSFTLPNESVAERKLLDQSHAFYAGVLYSIQKHHEESHDKYRKQWHELREQWRHHHEEEIKQLRQSYEEQLAKQVKAPPPSPPIYDCKKCAEKFSSNNQLHKHVDMQHAKKPAEPVEKSPTPQSAPAPMTHEEDMKKLRQSHEEELAVAQSTYQAKMGLLRERCKQLEQENEEKSQAWAKEKAEMQAQIAAASLPPSPPPSPPPHASPTPPTKLPQKRKEKHEKPLPTPPATPTKTTPSPPSSPRAPTSSSSSTPPPTYAQVASRDLSKPSPTKCTKLLEKSQTLNPLAPPYTPPHRRQKACMNMDDLFKKFRPSAQCSNSNGPIKFKRSNGSFASFETAKLTGQSHARNSANFAATSANSASARPTSSKAFSMPSSTPQPQWPPNLRQHGMKPSYWSEASLSPPHALGSSRKSLEDNGIAMLLQGLSQLFGNMGHGMYGQRIL